MSDVIDLIVEDARWHDVPLVDLAEQAADLALTQAGIETRNVEIACLACDDTRIAELNAGFRGKDAPTNVLSWPALDLFPPRPGAPPSRTLPAEPGGPVFLGDIAVAFDTVMREAAAGGIPAEHHVLHLLLHACLHLLGFDHQIDTDAAIMEALEERALASIGIRSPY